MEATENPGKVRVTLELTSEAANFIDGHKLAMWLGAHVEGISYDPQFSDPEQSSGREMRIGQHFEITRCAVEGLTPSY